MKKFEIYFEDAQGNDVYSVTKQFNDFQEATKYAELILASTSDDCISFNIYQF